MRFYYKLTAITPTITHNRPQKNTLTCPVSRTKLNICVKPVQFFLLITSVVQFFRISKRFKSYVL